MVMEKCNSLVILTKYLYYTLEGKPFRDVLSSSEHLTELGSRKLLDIKSLLLGLSVGNVSLLLSVYKVKRWYGHNSKTLGVFTGDILGIIGTVVVLSGDGGFGSSHITSYNEMCASEILTDHHVLDGLTGSGHVHGVRKVLPEGTGILGLLLEYLVSLITDNSWDIIGLGRSASGVYKYNSTLSYELIIKSTGEELIMGTVDGVTALEGNNILVLGESGTDLSRGLAWEITDGGVKSGNLSSHVITSTLGGNHEGSRVLNFGSSVTLEALKGLVGGELVSELNSGNWAVSVLKKNSHTGLKVLRVGIENNGKSEDKSIRKLHLLNNTLVSDLVHESGKGGESSVYNKLNVAKLTGGELKLGSTRGNSGGLSVIRVEHEVYKLSSVGNLLGHLESSGDWGRESNLVEGTWGTGGEGSGPGDKRKCSDSKLHDFDKLAFKFR